MLFFSQCGVISKHQYVKWRESGVAFEMREGLYQTANQSLLSTRVFNHVSRLTFYYNSCCYCVTHETLSCNSNCCVFVLYQRGDRVAVRGYWGDIVSSPYLSFGTETENKNLLKKQNNQHVKVKELVHYLPFKVTDNLWKVQVHIYSF